MNMSIFNDVPFDDVAALDDFKLALQVNHNTIAQRLFAQSKFYDTYPLIDSLEHAQDWQQTLQAELQSIYAAIGFTGLPDLSGADLSREEDFDVFFDQLVDVERRINVALDIL